MAETEIICERRGTAGFVVLDRQKALNALTLSMVRELATALDDWAHDGAVTRIVVTAARSRAFCAGGDIRLLHDLGRAGRHAEQLQFWREEYVLNRRIKRYPKPIVALIDGIVMGGGVGISVHATHRVASEKIQFAMPEASIGFFPDVGATYFLPRLPGRIGTYLALTGERIELGDAMASGLATVHVESSRLVALADALCEPGAVEVTIAGFAEAPPSPLRFADRAWIDHCFAAPSLIEIVARLDMAAPDTPSAAQAATKIRANSPMSLAIALRQMQIGRQLDIEAAMRTEFRVVSRICREHDFYEGVRAAILDRDNQPNWQPDRIEALTEPEVDAHFASLGDAELTFPDHTTETA